MRRSRHFWARLILAAIGAASGPAFSAPVSADPAPVSADPAPVSADPAPVSANPPAVPSPGIPAENDLPDLDSGSAPGSVSPFPGLPMNGLLLGKTGSVDANAAGREAFNLGYGSDAALGGPGGITLPDVQAAGFNLSGYVSSNPQAALPDEYSAGFHWAGQNSVALGDQRLLWNSGSPAVMLSTLRGVRTDLAAGLGHLAAEAGVERLSPRHVIISGAGSRGPYALSNTGPIASESVRVWIDGNPVNPAQYQVDPVSGLLSFSQQTISWTSEIDVRYEEALSEGDPLQTVAALSYSLNRGPGSSLNASMVTDVSTPRYDPGIENRQEGPFYGTGLPMTILLSRSDVTLIAEVTADGTPLRPSLDYISLPAERVLYIRRPLPRGAIVQVFYQRATTIQPINSSTAAALDGVTRLGPSGSLRWSSAAAGGSGSLDLSVARHLGDYLSVGARVRWIGDTFSIPSTLAETRRQSGLDLGVQYEPVKYLILKGTFLDASVPLSPFLDTLAVIPGPAQHVTGLSLKGSLAGPNMPQLRWAASRYQVGPSEIARQHIDADFLLHGWEWSGHLEHTLSEAETPVDTASVQTSLHGGIGSWLRTSMTLGTSHLSEAGLAENGRDVGVTLTAAPIPSVTLSAAGSLDDSPPLPVNQALTLSTLSLATHSDFDIDDAFEHSRAAGSLANRGFNFSSPGDSLPVQTPDLLVPGGLSGAAMFPTGIFPTGLFPGQPQHVRQLSLSARWMPVLAVAIEISHEENSTLDPGLFRQVSTLLSVHYRPLSAAPNAVILTGSAGEVSSWLVDGNGSSGSGLALNAGFEIAALRQWRFEGSLGSSAESSLLIPGLPDNGQGTATGIEAEPGGAVSTGAVSGSLYAARLISGGHVLFIQWQARAADGAGGFRSSSYAAGITLRIPLGLGLRLQAERIQLNGSLTTQPRFQANSFSVSLVTAAL